MPTSDHGHDGAFQVQPAHHHRHAAVFLTHKICRRHTAIVEHQLGRGRPAKPHLVQFLRHGETGKPALHHKRANALGAGRLVRLGINQQHIGHRPIGDIDGCVTYSFSVLLDLSGNSTTITYHATADSLKMSDLNGQSYEARFDGKDYPILGDPGRAMVSLKRISERIIEETDKRDGKVDSVTRMTVSPDGKSIHVVIDDMM